MATRLDRVSRSVADFAGILDRSARRGWGIVLLDSGIDTSNAAGRFTGNVLASAAQYERELISIRARKAEAVVFGRAVAPEFLPTYRLVHDLHDDGVSMAGIARKLNDDAVPTARGGRWHASTVRAMLTSETAKALWSPSGYRAMP